MRGKPPLFLKLKKGKYQVVIFHPPLEEIDKTYKEEWEEEKRGRFIIKKPKNPFIGPNMLMVFDGRSFWSVSKTVEIKDELKTVIGLFQRRDKHFTYLFPLLPKEENFEFTMKDHLRDFSKFKISGVTGRVPEYDIDNALVLIHRGGVFGWEIDVGRDLIIEITGKNNKFNLTALTAQPPMR